MPKQKLSDHLVTKIFKPYFKLSRTGRVPARTGRRRGGDAEHSAIPATGVASVDRDSERKPGVLTRGQTDLLRQ